MRKKIICILVMMLLIPLALTATATILTNKNVKEKTNASIKGEEDSSITIDLDNERSTNLEPSLEADRQYVNVPACAFIPNTDSTDYWICLGGYLMCNPTLFTWFYAPVYLPIGAKISELATWWEDGSSEEGHVTLW